MSDDEGLGRGPVWGIRLGLLALLLPLAIGWLIPTYRDAGVTHLPGKLLTREALLAGELPFVNIGASCGQPLLGNPNFATFFPDTLLFLLMPGHVAFGLHFALSLVVGVAGARRWARSEGYGRGTAELTGLWFGLSGPFLSAWTFYNAGMALALAPWVLAAAARLGRRARLEESGTCYRTVVELGVVSALEIAAGEPVVALLTFLVAGIRLLPGDLGTFKRQVRRAVIPGLAGLLLGGLLAAPQITTTWQASQSSSRDLFPYSFKSATETSVHPRRLVEQLAPLPFGRPDLQGSGGFRRHDLFGGHAPYLWSLHLGWLPLLLLILYSRPFSREERVWWLTIGVAAFLSLGRFLPFAAVLHPVLSAGGRIRYPVKLWYVVALALIPLVAIALKQWWDGRTPSRRRIVVAVVLPASAVLCTLVTSPVNLFSLGAVLVLVALGGRWRWRNRLRMALLVIAPLLLAHLPLLNALLDRPPAVGSVTEIRGRIFERVQVDPHPRQPAPGGTTRELFRRAYSEFWAITGSAGGHRYAFDRDPDGSYSFYDRVVRESIDQSPWADRVAGLRLAGVGTVIADESLPPPFVMRQDLGDGVRLYHLPGAAKPVRFATRIHRSPHFNGTLAIHRQAGFDPSTDTVLPGTGFSVTGTPDRSARIETVEHRTDRLRVKVRTSVPGVLVWGTTYHPAWQASVDGVDQRTWAADGHLVGVEVPAGEHDLGIEWDRTPLVVGGGLMLLGMAISLGACLYGRRRRTCS